VSVKSDLYGTIFHKQIASLSQAHGGRPGQVSTFIAGIYLLLNRTQVSEKIQTKIKPWHKHQ